MESSVNWEEIILEGMRNGENLSKVLERSAEVAPAEIKEILNNLPDTLCLNRKDVKTLKNKGLPLLLLHYYWLSGCGEHFRKFPSEMQKSILENGLEASIAGEKLASDLNEKKIEARFLLKRGTILYDLKRFSQAEKAFQKALTTYKKLAEQNPDVCARVAEVLNNLGNLYGQTDVFAMAEAVYSDAITMYRKLAEETPDKHTPDVAMSVHNLGNVYRRMRKFQKAEAAYTEALQTYRDIAEKNVEYRGTVALTLENLGTLYDSMNKYEEAEAVFTEAVETYRELAEENPEEYTHYLALTLNNVGSLYSHIRNFSEAEETFKEALEMKRKLAKENPEVYTLDIAEILGNLGFLYVDMRNFSEAEALCLEALRILRGNGDTHSHKYCSQTATALNNLGIIYSSTGKFKRAEAAYTEASHLQEALAKEYPDVYRADVAAALNNAGVIHSRIGNLEEAEHTYNKALRIYETLAQEYPDVYTVDVAMMLNNLGALYWRTSAFLQAENAYKKALRIYEPLAEEYPEVYAIQVATTLDNLGALYQHTHKFSEAEKAYTEALRRFRELEKMYPDIYCADTGMSLNNIGNLFWSTNQFSQAEKAYTEALERFRELEKMYPAIYSPDTAMALNNLGALYLDSGDLKKAEERFTEAVRIYRTLSKEHPDAYTPDLAMTLNNIGAAYQHTGNLQKAENVLTEALEKYRELARENPDAYDQYVVAALNNLGTFYRHTTNFKRAELALMEACTRAEGRTLWFELADVYHELSFLSNVNDKAVRALEFGILFSGEKKYTYAQKGRREEIYIEFLEKTDDPQKMYGVLEALRDSDLLSLKWDIEVTEDVRKNRNFQKILAGKLLKKKISSREVPHIPENVLFLYIQEMKDNILFLAVTKEGIQVLKGTSEFADVGRRMLVNLRVQMLGRIFRKDINDIVTKCDSLAAEWTYTLPTEILDVISKKDTIFFSSDGIISYFPLEGLSIHGEPICLSKKVLRATSMHQLQEIVSEINVDSSLIVGNPWPPTGETSFVYRHPTPMYVGYLKNAEEEAETLAETLPHPEVLLNSEATADRFLKKLSDHSLIHFAGHGYRGRVLFFSGPMSGFPPEFEPEEFSRLRRTWRSANGKTIYMMDEWDIVTDIDILNTPLKKGAFVFLSACETGKHKYAGGGHFQGLAQAFLKNGASGVISSLVPLYGTPARDFAASFYDNLLSGQLVGAALQNTRRKIKRKHKSHIYWLPYIHYGSSEF